ncbi:MAG TPA: putative PEP-binding protein, partial [Roseiflexaceae bacterium]|nr:putative PEP-binding protein [Roseiflexaceae bacterium]
SPASLRLFADIARRAAKAKIPVSLCGEMAGKPLEALALLGVGLRSLSMNPVSVAPVKAMVRSLDLPRFARFLGDLLVRGEPSPREILRAYAVDNDILT